MTKLYTLCNSWCNAVNSNFLNFLIITSITLTANLQSQAQCNNITNGGTICCNQTATGPYDPAQINNSVTPSGGSGNIEYLWIAKNASSGWNWTNLYQGSNDCYDPPSICETTIYRRCSRREGCSSWAGESNDITVTITGGCSPCQTYAGSPSLSSRVSSGIVALYTFQNGTGSTVADVSGVGTPMNLTIQNPANVTWLPTSGLSINTATTIKTTTAATKLHSALTASGNVSLEAWIKPTNTSQNGPARIMTMSSSSTVRNFTVGQDADNYIARLRTTSGGDNNGLPQLVSPDNAVSADFTQHVVYTRNTSGQEKLYINGVLVSSATKGGNFSNWVNTMSFALGNELSNDRPWLGKFFLVAVYSQELDLAEVTQNYNAAYPSYCSETCDAAITNLIFQNTTSNSQHGIIANGGSYITTTLPANWNIEALTSGSNVGSVKFTISGDYSATNIQNSAPFRTPDDNTPLNLGPGTYTVKAEVFKLDNATGIKCGESTVTFTILPSTTCVQVQQTCEITQANDHSVWISDGLKTALGLSSNNFVQVTPGILTLYSDGTLKVQGQVKNVSNASKKFNYVSYFRYKRNWANWSSIPHPSTPSGYREAKLDAGTSVTITNEYLNWDYYEMDPTKPNTITGIEGLAGLNLTVSHRPSDLRYAAQYGTKGSLQSEGLGFSAWIDVTGTYNSTSINSSGDYNFDLNNCVNGSAFAATATTVQPTCTSSCGGSIAINATGGLGNYTYAWSNGATTATISSLCAGNYSCTVTSGNCTQVVNVVIAISGPCCNNVTSGGTIAANQTGCGTFDPAMLTSTADPSGGTGTLEIIWIKKSAANGWVYETIVGANGPTYDPPAITETTIYRRCARRVGCTDYVGESNEITIGVTPCDYDGEICFNGIGNPVGAEVQFHVDYDVNPTLGTVKIRTSLSKNFVDNTYGANAVGWNNGHTFSNLTGSDHLQLSLYDANNIKKLEFKLDYLTASAAGPSGYDCLGVTGGEGQMMVGSATNVLSATTSLDQNFNTYGYVLTSTSPATDANYTPNATSPNWIYDVWYEVTVRLDAFGAAGFGTVDISGVHASPSKTGNNTELVDPGPCACDAICPTDVTVECGSPITPDVTGAPTSDCNAQWTYTDEVCPYAFEPTPNEGQVCFEGLEDQSIGAQARYLINYTDNGNGTLTVRTTFSKNFVDNTYGTNVIGWPNGHTFGNLTGSDHLRLSLYDAANTKKLEFKLDYLTATNTSPTGYDCLGVTGGDGQMIIGSASSILSATSSLDQNFNTYGYVLTTNSPASDNSYTPNASYPNWIYEVWYEVTVSLAAFGPNGFGSIGLAGIHASPSKTGSNTELVQVTDCPLPCNGHVSSPCESIIVRHWTSPQAADACDQIITVVDTTAPVANLDPADVSIQCNEAMPEVPNVTFTDCHAVTSTYLQSETTNANGSITYTRVWTGNDGCGHSTTVNQIITRQPCNAELGNYVWYDSNINGVQDTNENGVSGVTVSLYNCTNTFITSTTTNASGIYLFTGLVPGQSYYVQFSNLPATYVFTAANSGSNEALDSDAAINNGQTACVTLAANQSYLDLDAGITTCSVPQISGSAEPLDVTIQCTEQRPAAPILNFYDPIYGSLVATYTEVFQNDNCLGRYYRTWVVTNPCGTTTTIDQIVDIIDNIPPVLMGVPTSNSIECGQPVADAVVSATDNCSTNLIIGMSATTVENNCGRALIRTWTVTDECGNTTSASQTTTMIDTTAPTLIGLPVSATVACGALPQLSAFNVSAQDNCDTNVETIVDVAEGGSGCSLTRTFTWSATDACGNTAMESRTFTTSDNVAPTLINLPNSTTVACNALPTPGMYSVTANDNCDTNVSVSTSFADSNEGCQTVRTITWTATDDCGNTATESRTFTTQDTVAPVLIGVPANATILCGQSAPAANVIASDNCTENVEVVMSVTNIPTPCGYTILRTWTATDDCGNITTASQELTTVDTTPPVITAPANTTVECTNIPEPEQLIATDNCNGNVTVTSEDVIDQLDNCEYNIIRTYTATDGCGNSASAIQTITVSDQTNPEFVNIPENITVQCNSIPSAIAVMATDNCDNDVQITFEEYLGSGCPYTITRTWYAVDNCGNSNSISQIITVIDNEAPVLMGVPENTTQNCGTVAQNVVVFATDNCDNNVTVNMTATTEMNACGSVFIRTWTATDDCGNTASASQQVDFIDSLSPVVTVSVPAQLSFECNQTIPLNEPKFEDNCDDMLTLTYAADTNYTSQCGYDIIRSWMATDNCGNSTSVYQTIHVTDATPPVLLNVPANASVECSNIPAAANVTASDNCATNMVVSYNETTTTGCPYTINRTWSTTDNCGNTTTQTQTITVVDTTAPALIGVPANTTVECNAISEPPVVTAADNCDQNIVVTFNQTTNQGSGCQYTIVRTWSATDNCNNTTTQSQSITVNDTTPPVLAGVPQNITVECNNIPEVAVVTASDLCDDDVPVTINQTMTGGCPNIITRTWTAVDNCGNQTMLSQTITCVDTVAPAFESTPENLTVQCNQIPAAAAMIANDVCDDQVEIIYNQTIDTGCPYSITRTWTAIDNCGNQTIHAQVISVIDNEYPVLVGVPDNATISCGQPIPDGSVFATDNCTQDLNIGLTVETVNNDCGSVMTRVWTVTDNCGNTTTAIQTITTIDVTPPVLNGVPANSTVNCNNIPPAPIVTAMDDCSGMLMPTLVETISNGCPYTITRTWTATDACGNTASSSQIITVNDNEAPTLSGVPANQTVECSAIPAIANVTAADQCDTSLEILYDEHEVVVNNCSYQIIRTWSVADACGNQTTQSQTLTVVDTTNPTVVTAPQANMTVQCNGDLTVTAPTFDDNCDEDLSIEFISGISNTTNCSYDIERTWVATDNCGNSITVSQTVHVVDNTAPVLAGIPAETTAECNNIPAPALVSATDNCDTTLNVVFSETTVPNTCGSTITRTWTVADDCGNTSNASQIIHVVDNNNPQIIVDPEDASYECSDALPNITPVFTDDCDTDLTIVPTSEMEELECGYILHKSWTATDNCGNSAVVYQDITISDNTAPTLLGVPISYEVECTDIPVAPMVIAQDNCDSDIEVIFSETQTTGCQYTITRTWYAQDRCGNEVTAEQIIYVVDNTSPVINAPASMTAECSNIPQAPTLTATDNCDSDVQVEYSQSQAELENCTYTITRTWVATDDCNNQSTAVQVITVVDTTAPVFATAVTDQTVQCDAVPAAANVTATDNCSDVTVTMEESATDDCSYTITRLWTATDACGNTAALTQHLYVVDEVAPVFASFPEDQTISCTNGTPPVVSATATDNCDNNVVITTNDMIVNAACGYQIKRTYIATDNCGNAVTGVQMITVIDETPPLVFNVPDDITVGCNAPIPGYSSAVTAQDNCDSSPTITVNDIIVQQECGYLIKRFYNATDDCGNQGAGLQMITVIDETAPQFTSLPADVTVNCGSIPNPAELAATDLCDNSLEYTYSESVISVGCPQQIKRIWTATDNCGNTATAVQVITVIDNDAPVFDDYEVFMQIPCDQVAEFMLTATDGCDNDVEVTVINELLFSGSCYGTLQRTYEATDECGNVTTAMQLLDIIDPTAPVLHNIPAETYVLCGGAVPSVPNNIYATDNCSQDMEITFTEVQSGTFCPYNIIRTWTVTDLCGNTTEATQIIHFTVDVAPVVMLTAFPNPSTSGQIRVMFSVPQDEEVSAIVFDALGRQTQVLLQGTATGGTLYDWTLNTNNIGTGTYTLRVMVGDDMYIERFILLDN